MIHFKTSFTHAHPVGDDSPHAADARRHSSGSSRMQFGTAAANAARVTANAVKTTASRVADTFHSIDPAHIAALFARLSHDSHELKAKLAQMGKKAAVAAQGIEQRLRQRLGEALGRHLPAGTSLKEAFARLNELSQHAVGRAGRVWSELRKQLSPEKIATMSAEQWTKLLNSFKSPEHAVLHGNMRSLLQHVGIREFSRLNEHDWQTVLAHLAKGSKFESALQQAGKQTYYVANWEAFTDRLSRASVNVEDYIARHPEKLLSFFIPKTGAGRTEGGPSAGQAHGQSGAKRTHASGESAQRSGFNRPDSGPGADKPGAKPHPSTQQPRANAGFSQGNARFGRQQRESRQSASGQRQGNTAPRPGFDHSRPDSSEPSSAHYERPQAGYAERPAAPKSPHIEPVSLMTTPRARMLDELVKHGFPKAKLPDLRNALANYLGHDPMVNTGGASKLAGHEFQASFGKYFAEDVQSAQDRKGFGLLYLELKKHTNSGRTV